MVNVARPKATQGESKTTRGEGLVPRWGRGVARRNPPCQTTTRAFSYLGAPAPAGPLPDLVIPAKAGIQRGWEGMNATRRLVSPNPPPAPRFVIPV